MHGKKMMIGMTAALGLLASSAQADGRLPLAQIDTLLAQAEAFGFQRYEEIEAQRQDSVEIEGWLDDEWYADVRLSLSSGESLREERRRLTRGAWGMTAEEVRQAAEVAANEGMITFEGLQVEESGMIEIEGEDENGRDLEVQIRQGESRVASVEHD